MFNNICFKTKTFNQVILKGFLQISSKEHLTKNSLKKVVTIPSALDIIIYQKKFCQKIYRKLAEKYVLVWQKRYFYFILKICR